MISESLRRLSGPLQRHPDEGLDDSQTLEVLAQKTVSKAPLRAQLCKDVEAFCAAGGEIRQVGAEETGWSRQYPMGFELNLSQK